MKQALDSNIYFLRCGGLGCHRVGGICSIGAYTEAMPMPMLYSAHNDGSFRH